MKRKLILIIVLSFFMTTQVNAKNLYNELKNNSVKDNIGSTYVSSPNGIDFMETSSDTNGKGLYMMGDTANDTYPILYYRGDIHNNNLIYAGYCWHIVRTTSTGGIKIMYAGVPENSTCNNTQANLTIGKSQYNDSNDAPKYGWTYDVNGVETDSLAKSYLDNWYANNMTDYTRELEDTIWCNDRRLTDNIFDVRTRLEAGNPTLSCEYDDSYTVDSNKGNGKLTYPTAIINADEVTYAGEVLKKTQTSAYVNISSSYWAMTPYVLSKNMYPNSKGMLNMYTFTYNTGIRPMVSLRNTAEITTGDGTNNNPYRVEIEKQYKIITDEYSTTNVDESEKNKTITITPKERDGYKLVDIKLYDLEDNLLNIPINNNQFTMPEYDVKVKTNYRVVKESHNVISNQNEIIIMEEIVEEDQKASFKINIPHGYKLVNIKLLDSNSQELDIELVDNNGSYEFTMPGFDVIVNAILEELPKYEVSGEDIILDDTEYYADDKVEFSVKEKEGMEVDKIIILDEDDEELDIKVTKNGNKYSFNMPDKNVKVLVDYKKVQFKGITNPLTSAKGIVNNIKNNKLPILLISIVSIISILFILGLYSNKKENK